MLGVRIASASTRCLVLRVIRRTRGHRMSGVGIRPCCRCVAHVRRYARTVIHRCVICSRACAVRSVIGRFTARRHVMAGMRIRRACDGRRRRRLVPSMFMPATDGGSLRLRLAKSGRALRRDALLAAASGEDNHREKYCRYPKA